MLSKKKRAHPIEQFERFMVPCTDLGDDGVTLARTGNGYLVWFPGRTGWAVSSKCRYRPVSLYWIEQKPDGQWKQTQLAAGGRFNKARYTLLLPTIRKRMKADIQIDDIDVSRRRFTTVFS